MMSGMITNVCRNAMTSHQSIGLDEKTFQMKRGHARIRPKARQYSRPCP